MRARDDFTLILVTLKADQHGKTKKVWHYRLANHPKRQKKSTGVIGQRNHWQAEARVRKLLTEQMFILPCVAGVTLLITHAVIVWLYKMRNDREGLKEYLRLWSMDKPKDNDPKFLNGE